MARSLISWRALGRNPDAKDVLRAQATIQELRCMFKSKGRPLSLSALTVGESSADQMLALLRVGLDQSVVHQYSRLVRPTNATPDSILGVVRFLTTQNDVVVVVAPDERLVSDLAWQCAKIPLPLRVKLRQAILLSEMASGEASTLVWT